VRATNGVWLGDTLRVQLEATLILDGAPLNVVERTEGFVLDPALTEGLSHADPLIIGENADDVMNGVSVEVLIRDRDTSIDWPVRCTVNVELARTEDVGGSYFALVRGHGDLDPTTLAGGSPLARGSWDVVVRVSMWGLQRTARLAVDDGLHVATLARLVGSPGVQVLPYATSPHGKLTLDVDQRRKKIEPPGSR